MKQHPNKLISVLLVFSVMISMLSGFATVNAVESEKNVLIDSSQNEGVVDLGSVDDELTVSDIKQLTANSKVLNYVDEEVFKKGNHIARMTEEETLSTYVFQNANGSRTVYYMNENIKFLDASGKVREKDISLVSKKGGYGIALNEFELTIPNDPISGIQFVHGSKQISLIPQGGSAKAGTTQKVDNTIRYDNYFGVGIDLVYTPILSGLKEDIVLDKYTGANEFSFLLNTNGLSIYQEGQSYFMAVSQQSEDRLHLGDVLVYDAKGEPSMGQMSIVTITEGQQYRLTVSADVEFLTDEDTRYPVTIDPTITIRGSSTTDDAIEDATIFSNKTTTNAGTWIYAHCGYYDSSYGIGRLAVRLKGLINDSGYAAASATDIQSVEFYIKETSGTAASPINLHALTTNSTWTETGVNWSNVGGYSSTIYATASPAYNAIACFDITSLAKAWKNNEQNPNCGFILIGANESLLDKVLLTSECATSTNRPYVVATYTYDSGSLNYMSTDIDEGATKQLTLSGVSGTVNWTSSDSSVATVSSSGLVTGVKAGTATITASADGYTPRNCTVYVTVEDGMYYIRGSYGLYLGLTDSPYGHPPVRLLQYSTEGVAQVKQLWRINYLGEGLYSLRPLYMLNVALTSASNSVCVDTVGVDDSLGGVSSLCQWGIVSGQNGYSFFLVGTSSMSMRPADGAASPGLAVITAVYNSSNSHYEWSLEKLSPPTNSDLLVNVELSFDYGLKERDGSRGDISSTILDINFLNTAHAFAQQCGIYLVSVQSSIVPHLSDADKCVNSSISSNCECSNCLLMSSDDPTANNSAVGFLKASHCKSIIRLRNNLLAGMPDNTIRVMFTGHNACWYDSQGHGYGVGGLSSYTHPIICIKNSPVSGYYSITTLAHEIAHIYQVGHHDAIEGQNCIMTLNDNRYWFDPENGVYWCSGCLDVIRNNKDKV